MPTVLSTTITAGVRWAFRNQPVAGVAKYAFDNNNFAFSATLANGDGSEQAEQVWWDQRTLVVGSEALDLAGVLENQFGQTATFAAVKLMYFENLNDIAETSDILSIGGAAANQFVNWVGAGDDVIKIPAGGCFLLTAPGAGYAVTGGTGDQLKIAAAGHDIVYNVALVGVAP